jgi:hypothetical protein
MRLIMHNVNIKRATSVWRRLLNEELCALYFAPKYYSRDETKKLDGRGLGEREGHTEIWRGNLRE